jgi:hypothetical protein
MTQGLQFTSAATCRELAVSAYTIVSSLSGVQKNAYHRASVLASVFQQSRSALKYIGQYCDLGSGWHPRFRDCFM